MPSKKIISLSPAATETACALGLETYLAGRSSECDLPASVISLPVCSTPRFDIEAKSAEIDQQIKDFTANSDSWYELNRAMIRNIQPDLIVVLDQQDASSFNKEIEEVVGDVSQGSEILFLHAASIDDVFNDIMTIASKTGVASRADVLIDELKERRDIIRHKLKFVEDRPSVVHLEWLFPLKAGKGIQRELIEIAGGRPLLTEKEKGLGYLDLESLKIADPEVLIIAPRGFSIERTIREIDLLIGLEGWQDLSAVKNDKVFIVDGRRYLNNVGPAMIDTMEILAEILQPKQFMFGYEGESWVKFGLNNTN